MLAQRLYEFSITENLWKPLHVGDLGICFQSYGMSAAAQVAVFNIRDQRMVEQVVYDSESKTFVRSVVYDSETNTFIQCDPTTLLEKMARPVLDPLPLPWADLSYAYSVMCMERPGPHRDKNHNWRNNDVGLAERMLSNPTYGRLLLLMENSHCRARDRLQRSYKTYVEELAVTRKRLVLSLKKRLQSVDIVETIIAYVCSKTV